MSSARKGLKIGLKYCGGCNPEYDRVRAVEQITERLQGKAEFCPPGNKDLDIILVVEGCATACADTASFEGKEVRVLTGPDDVEKFIKGIEPLLKEEVKGGSAD